MATYIKPEAIKDGTISASKTDETVATKSYVDTQIRATNDKVDDFINAGYLYAGTATPEIVPGTLEAKVFYIANGKGTYTNFGGLEVTEDEVVILYYDTEWHKVATGIASKGKLTELEEAINGAGEPTTSIYNSDVTISSYGNTRIVFAETPIVGKSYKISSPNGVVRLQVLAPSWTTIAESNVADGVFEWKNEYASNTGVRLVSREAESKTFSIDISSIATHIEGLIEKVEKLSEGAKQTEGEILSIKNDIQSISSKYPNINGRSLYLEGASFADWNIGFEGDSTTNPGNGWFELACDRLGLIPLNKARSGSSIVDFARGISGIADSDGHKVNAPWTDEEFESFDILCIMHVHNYNVADASVLKTDYDGSEPFLNTPLKSTARVGYICTSLLPQYYAQAFDYVLKEYAKKCYACKDKVGSRWYGTKMGKPFKVIVCTHWHDARATFNDAVRTLQQKWGFELCEFDKHIGFSKNQVNPATNSQFSIDYCNNASANTEVIDGITYGWHQTRGKDAYIQKAMASIFADAIKPILCDSDFTK